MQKIKLIRISFLGYEQFYPLLLESSLDNIDKEYKDSIRDTF